MEERELAGKFGALVILAIGLFISIGYYAANHTYLYLVSYLWFGMIYGLLQQWGRFCFASAWRDLILFKITRMFVGIMIAFVGLSILTAFMDTWGWHTYHASPFGVHELVGGVIFGLGMVFAGGCATGTLYKTGEGNLASLTVLLTLSLSQAIFAAYFLLARKTVGMPQEARGSTRPCCQ